MYTVICLALQLHRERLNFVSTIQRKLPTVPGACFPGITSGIKLCEATKIQWCFAYALLCGDGIGLQERWTQASQGGWRYGLCAVARHKCRCIPFSSYFFFSQLFLLSRFCFSLWLLLPGAFCIFCGSLLCLVHCNYHHVHNNPHRLYCILRIVYDCILGPCKRKQAMGILQGIGCMCVHQ